MNANINSAASARTRAILEDLEAVRENLLALSDDIWLSIDHNDPQALEEGVQFKRAYNEKAIAFDRVATELSALVQQYTSISLEAGERTGADDREQNERIVAELTDLFVTHSGSDHSPHGRIRKLDRDFRLLQLELAEKPDHPFVLFNLGMTHLDADQLTEAKRYLNRYLEVASPVESTFRKGYALLVACLCRLDEFDDAWTHCQQGLQRFPDDKELLFRSGVILHQFGRLQEAEQAYQRVLTERVERHFTSVDRAIAGYKARHNLALVYEEMETWPKAEMEWRQITDEEPGYELGWKGLRRVLLRQGRREELLQVATRLRASQPQLAVGPFLAAAYFEAIGRPCEAECALDEALQISPNDADLLRERARLQFEFGTPADSVRVLESLTALIPEDAAAFHNLSVAYLHAGRPGDAVAAAQESVAIRPDSVATWSVLAQSLRESGQFEGSQSALQRISALKARSKSSENLQPSIV